MKTLKYCVAVLVMVAVVSVESQTVFKLDSLHQFSWDTDLSDWRHDTRELFAYDNGDNKETNLLRLILNGGVWENFYQFNKTYNTNGDIETSIRQNWDGMNWQNSERFTYQYNTDDLVQTLSYAIFINPVWQVFNENTYVYDVLGNNIEDVLTEYDFVSMMLRNKERRTYDFASSIINYEILEQWRDVLNDWENEERRDYFYDTNSVLIREEVSGWNIGSGVWSNPYQQFLYAYNTDDLVEEIIEQLYVTDTWINENRTLFTYTSNNLTELLGQQWSNSMMVWENDFRQVRSFDIDDNEIELIFETWDAAMNTWEGIVRILKYWSPAETLSVVFQNSVKVSVYPNPVIDRLTIKLNAPVNTALTVDLYNMNGQLVRHKMVPPNTTEISLNLQYESTTSYILHLTSNGKKEIFKILKN